MLTDFKTQDINTSSELENYISGKLANNLGKEELMGIDVLRYSFYFWQ